MGCGCAKPSKILEPEARPKASAHPSLGIVRCDYQYEAPPGDVDCPASFGYDVHYRVVPGMHWEVLGSGKLTPEVEKNLVAGIKHLESKGVCAITGDCGMMYQFQKITRANTNLPVLMSSFYQVPLIQTLFSEEEKILVLTAWKEGADAAKYILTSSGFQGDQNRFVFDAFADLAGVEFISQGDTFVYNKFAPALVQRAKDCIAKEPRIRAIIFECTEMPPYADVMRKETGLPVYDAITMCDFFMSSCRDNPRNNYNWQAAPCKKTPYFFGQGLSEEEKQQLQSVRPHGDRANAAVGIPEAHHHPEFKSGPAVLGCLLCDRAGVGGHEQVSFAGSLGYEVRCKSVPGLSLDMCKEGEMPDKVRQAFVDTIRQLENSGAAAITGDSSFFLHFQDMAIEAARVPVFLSPLLMYPMLQTFFEENERILIVTMDQDNMVPMKEVWEKCKLPQEKNCKYEIVGVLQMGLSQEQEFKRTVLPEVISDPVQYCSEFVKNELWKNTSQFADAFVEALAKRFSQQKALRAILLESELLEPFADQLRHKLNVPVFDAISICDYVLAGSRDNPRFGINFQSGENGTAL